MRRSIAALALASCAEAAAPEGTEAGTIADATGPGSDSGANDDGTTSAGTTGDVADTSAANDDSTSGDVPDGPPTLARIGETFPIPTLAASMPKRFADAAHDPAGDVYLVVNGNAAISGAFVSADGSPIGQPFQIADTTAWTQGVRVAYGGDAFLVAWHDNRDAPDHARLRARRVAWDGSAAVLGADVEIGTGETYSEMPPALAWSTTSSAFLVAWHTTVGDDIHAQRVDAEGTRVGTEIVVTTDPDWQSDVGMAWNPALDQWLLAYTHAGATTEVRARTIAADGTLVGAETSMTTAAGTWLAHVAFVPDRGEYVVAWFEGAITARRVGADGTPIGDPFVLAPGYGSYDGFSMAYGPATATFAAVFHGTTDEDWAAAFAASGEQSVAFEATSSRGVEGNFNPRIAAHSTRAEWLVVTSRGFAEVVGQRLGP